SSASRLATKRIGPSWTTLPGSPAAGFLTAPRTWRTRFVRCEDTIEWFWDQLVDRGGHGRGHGTVAGDRRWNAVLARLPDRGCRRQRGRRPRGAAKRVSATRCERRGARQDRLRSRTSHRCDAAG